MNNHVSDLSKVTVIINQKSKVISETSKPVLSIKKILFDCIGLNQPEPFAAFDFPFEYL